MKLNCYELNKQPENYAAILFAAESIKDSVIEELNEVFGEESNYVLDVWFDHYDSSIELGFSDRAPIDLQGGPEIRELLKKWGFAIGYLNFTNNTQQVIYTYTDKIMSRADWGWDNTHRWNKQQADKLE